MLENSNSLSSQNRSILYNFNPLKTVNFYFVFRTIKGYVKEGIQKLKSTAFSEL